MSPPAALAPARRLPMIADVSRHACRTGTANCVTHDLAIRQPRQLQTQVTLASGYTRRRDRAMSTSALRTTLVVEQDVDDLVADAARRARQRVRGAGSTRCLFSSISARTSSFVCSATLDSPATLVVPEHLADDPLSDRPVLDRFVDTREPAIRANRPSSNATCVAYARSPAGPVPASPRNILCVVRRPRSSSR